MKQKWILETSAAKETDNSITEIAMSQVESV